MKTRKATLDDLQRMLEIEESAIPGYGYLFENKEFYFDGVQNQGEMILALDDDLPVGMGQYSILPDGSGWLEILRVHKDYQRKGAGRAIYERYNELSRLTNAPSVAMFTGHKNIASKTLAEINGFSLAAVHTEYAIEIKENVSPSSQNFHLLTDPEELKRIIEKEGSWGPFLAMNRTYFHYGLPLYKWLIDRKMVYTDGNSTLILGCRMLKHRGWHIGWMCGNLDHCIEFAIARTAEEKLPKLTISFPPEKEEIIAACTQHHFTPLGELIVMERQSKENQHV